MTTQKKKTAKCQQCNRPAKNKLTDRHLCDRCFLELAMRKLRRNLREYDLEKGQKITFLDEQDRQVFTELIQTPLKLKITKYKRLQTEEDIQQYLKKNPKESIALPSTLDDEDESFLEEIFNHKKNTKDTQEKDKKKKTTKNQETDTKRTIRLYRPLTRSETNTYLKIKHIKKHLKQTELGQILEKFESRYPGTKTSIAQSAKEFRELIADHKRK
jgi:hypothetical protein